MIIPCHINDNHWTLAVVRFSTKFIEYYDSLGGGGQVVNKVILMN
jgi:Ulp1 family protease